MTKELLHLKKNDELILHDIFGSITYKDEGVFIAGGAGVTPFISIFRQLQLKNKIGNNKLIFANKTSDDVIHEEMFKNFLGKNFINILPEEKKDGYVHGHINEEFLKINIADLDTQIYLCGPDPMMVGIERQLKNLGGGKLIIKEKF